MVSGIAGYGGRQGIPAVGQEYWTSFLVSIPGNPCGSGSSSVSTDLVLPPHTAVDTSRPIRCFGTNRFSDNFFEITGQSWSFHGYTGPYCPTQASTSARHQGGLHFGFRPLANGQMFQIFVPVKSTAPLNGIGGGNPPHAFRWLTDATGVYANPGLSEVFTTVVQTSGGGAPFIYFARDPSVVPFWDATAASGQESKAEWFANLYSAGHAGAFCFELHNGRPPASDPAPISCGSVAGWNSTVTAGPDTWQVFGSGTNKGPNGGYVPFAYSFPDFQYTIRWKFTYNPGSGDVTVFKDIGFKTLAGVDTDGDGVADVNDQCDNDKGTLPNGCMPPVESDPDKDGVFGANDKCPAADGKGALDGCPPSAPPPPPGPPPPPPGPTGPSGQNGPVLTKLVAKIGTKRNARFQRSKLAKGIGVGLFCDATARATGNLSVASAVAKKLKLPIKRTQKTLAIGTGAKSCAAKAGAKRSGGILVLKVKPAYLAKLRRARGTVPATLEIVFRRTGSTVVRARIPVRLV